MALLLRVFLGSAARLRDGLGGNATGNVNTTQGCSWTRSKRCSWHAATRPGADTVQKRKEPNCPSPSSFFHVSAQSLFVFSMSIIEHRICTAPVFAFKQRLNNQLHLFWYHHMSSLHCSLKAAVLFVVMYVSLFAILQTIHTNFVYAKL